MNNITVESLLEKAYACIARLWCSPQDVDLEEEKCVAAKVAQMLPSLGQEAGTSLAKYLEADSITEEDYIDLFELNPKCPLYLGSHGFDEPKTCAQAAVSDRNEYMIELNAIYKHFGFEVKDRELPDYLPLMIEFLSLTAHRRSDALRKKFVNEYMLEFLAPMSAKLEELDSPYLHLLKALEGLLRWEKSNTEDSPHD